MLLISVPAVSYFDINIKDKSPEMNGIKLNDYIDFPSKWSIVTVRYRVDSKEIRITYANEKAVRGLKKNKPLYEDGAVFGKVSFLVDSDPAFPSSLIPSVTRRYQLMVRGSKKYAETDGWGYALFDASGQLYNEDMKVKTMACAACHRVVPERGFVFSRFAPFAIKGPAFLEDLAGEERIKFEIKPCAQFPSALVREIATKDCRVSVLVGEIAENVFSGTLDEVVPLLLDRVKQNGLPALLFSSEKNYSLVAPSKEPCLRSEEKKYSIRVVFNGGQVKSTDLCK